MLRSAVAIALVLLTLFPELASAHGPCGCLTPREGAPGTRIHAAYSVYKVIFNPDRTDLAIGPRPLWARHHGGPPITVLRRTWRYSRRSFGNGGTFVVPRVAPGRYLVALYDGGESGVHYTWETFTVLRADPRPAQPAPARAGSSDGVAVPLFVGAVVAALLGGLAAGATVSRRRRPTA